MRLTYKDECESSEFLINEFILRPRFTANVFLKASEHFSGEGNRCKGKIRESMMKLTYPFK